MSDDIKDPEIRLIGAIERGFAELDHDARFRVLAWAYDYAHDKADKDVRCLVRMLVLAGLVSNATRSKR